MPTHASANVTVKVYSLRGCALYGDPFDARYPKVPADPASQVLIGRLLNCIVEVGIVESRYALFQAFAQGVRLPAGERRKIGGQISEYASQEAVPVQRVRAMAFGEQSNLSRGLEASGRYC